MFFIKVYLCSPSSSLRSPVTPARPLLFRSRPFPREKDSYLLVFRQRKLCALLIEKRLSVGSRKEHVEQCCHSLILMHCLHADTSLGKIQSMQSCYGAPQRNKGIALKGYLR